jgi:hypothetical protein
MNKDEIDLEVAHKLKKKLMTVVLGHKDYIIMSAMTFAMASLLIWANSNQENETIEEALDLMDKQLREAVKGALENRKRGLS